MNPSEPRHRGLPAPRQVGLSATGWPCAVSQRSHTSAHSATRGTRVVPGVALAVAAQQHGVLSWDQASRAGVTKSDARRLVRNGEWGRPHTGVYSIRSLVPPTDSDAHLHSVTMAAQLALGTNSFAGGETAARLWGMRGLPRWDGRTVHMVIPALGAQRHHHRITLHSWQVSPAEISTTAGVRLTKPDRTLRDTLLRVDRETAVCLMDSALHQGLILEEASRGWNWPTGDARAV